MKNVTLSGGMPKKKSILLNNKVFIEIISSLLILLFVYTGINKYLEINNLKYVLTEYPIISNFPEIVAWGLPATELIVAALLFIPKTRLIGMYSSLVLMSGFTLYLIYMLIYAPKLPCTCGGMLRSLTWNQHLFLNISFVLISALGIWLLKKRSDQV